MGVGSSLVSEQILREFNVIAAFIFAIVLQVMVLMSVSGALPAWQELDLCVGRLSSWYS